TGPGEDLPFAAAAVADDQPMPVLVQLVSVPLDVRGDLGLQRRRQHPLRAVADKFIQQRQRTRLRWGGLSNYREHGRTFPTGGGTPALLEDLHRGYREGTSSPLLRAVTTLASAHPQVSSIARRPISGVPAVQRSCARSPGLVAVLVVDA